MKLPPGSVSLSIFPARQVSFPNGFQVCPNPLRPSFRCRIHRNKFSIHENDKIV